MNVNNFPSYETPNAEKNIKDIIKARDERLSSMLIQVSECVKKLNVEEKMQEQRIKKFCNNSYCFTHCNLF